MITFDEIFGSKEMSKELDTLLLEIQAKYSLWFKDKLGTCENGKPKSIVYYKIMNYPGNGSIGFNIDLELPEHIKKECHEAFLKIYKRNIPN